MFVFTGIKKRDASCVSDLCSTSMREAVGVIHWGDEV
jgi:hypothetical protein